MSKIAVINCGSTKKQTPTPSREMYDKGHLFRTIRDFVEQDYDQYYILSGHYGLMDPNEIIEPYDDVVFFVQKIFRERAKKQGKVLKAVSKPDQKLWGKKVWDAIDWEKFDQVDFFINIYYWAPLKPYFEHNPTKFQHHKFQRRLGPNLKEFKNKLK